MGFGVVALIESFILLILFLLHTHTHPHEPSLYSANNSVWFLGLSQNVLGTEKLCPFSATFFRSDRKVNGRRALSFILGYLLSGRRISRPTRSTAQPILSGSLRRGRYSFANCSNRATLKLRLGTLHKTQLSR